MVHLTLLLGREVVGVYTFTKTEITVGRDPDLDIVIDNPSVSRRQAAFKLEGSIWRVTDLGSANGTFLDGAKITGPSAVRPGDEVDFGKYSILFDRAVDMARSAPHRKSHATAPSHDGTIHIRPSEVKGLVEGSGRNRSAQLHWRSGGEEGVHYFVEAPAVLVGTGELCDVRVPKAPRNHVLAVRENGGCRIRNLHGWTRMRTSAGVARTADLKDGETVKIGPLELTFVGDVRDA